MSANLRKAQQPYNFKNSHVYIGWFVLALLILLGGVAWHYYRVHNPIVAGALFGGSIAAFATAAGTLPVLLTRNFSEAAQDSMMGFGAGVMLAACSFSLILPGIEAAAEQGMGNWGSALVIGGSILLGAGMMLVMEHLSPHEHFIAEFDAQGARTIRRTWLFVFAIALHNVPEGLAIGVAYGSGNLVQASALAIGIAIQDIPEGLVVAIALLGAGYKKHHAVLIGVASGFVEPIAATFGALVINLSQMLLPWGLGFAAGAMLFVISHELIPESHRKGHEGVATAGLIIGFVVMMLLDVALG